MVSKSAPNVKIKKHLKIFTFLIMGIDTKRFSTRLKNLINENDFLREIISLYETVSEDFWIVGT